QALDPAFRFVASRQHDNRHRRGGADESCELEAGLARHHHVEDQQVEMQAVELGAGILRTHRGGDAITLAAEKPRQQIANAAVVVDQQQMRRVVGRLRWCSCDGCGLGHVYSFIFATEGAGPKMVCNTLSGSCRSIMAPRNWRMASRPAGSIPP